MSYQTDINSIPEEYRPMSPWAYFGYSILFALPVIGFILLIVFSFVGNRIARKNYARSMLLAMGIYLVLSIVLAMIGAV